MSQVLFVEIGLLDCLVEVVAAYAHCEMEQAVFSLMTNYCSYSSCYWFDYCYCYSRGTFEQIMDDDDN